MSLCTGFLAVGRGLLFAVVQGLSSPGILLLWSTHSRHMGLWPTGLTIPRHVESSRSQDRAHVPHIGRQIPNQWTTKGVPRVSFLNETFHLVASYAALRKELSPMFSTQFPSMAPSCQSWSTITITILILTVTDCCCCHRTTPVDRV